MLALEFPGCRTLVDALDHAVSHASTTEITDALRNTLCRLIREQEVELPACVFEAHPEHYARRELYRSEQHGYCVTAMTWGPGQGTPIHDHSGMWCVEGVWRGALEITQYELLEHEERRYRFNSVGAIQAGPGSAGSLIPPHEYHTIRNPSADDVAVSLHIYSGPMTQCAVFAPLEGQWYERGDRALSLDQLH
ncbi:MULTISPECIES: cysteine dioxygenase family protein [Oleiagrimonas]|jgi:3-mercaptopropionate dioxygenase|uniref:Cysteine dioxygenase n=1 Tax=Oleiagrimonas citrea TaxID=1665687 RepID=A0A846ZMH1_9GAMM|nr:MULTISPECIES: cysteine dioxygenase family protein [Oleiagrimonas]NKZ39052.1 cysteine dioxygenase [Oleiagrimonas citrea]RAP57663.1 cysteine dioxygenase [Oleiagrimonas sp. MCCC 1A03011]